MKLATFLVLSTVVVSSAHAADPETITFYQRGVAPREAFHRVFDVPGGRLAQGGFNYTGPAKDVPAAFEYKLVRLPGGEYLSPFDDISPYGRTAEDFRDMNNYSITGTQKQRHFEMFGKQGSAQVADAYFPNDNGYWVTFRETPVPSVKLNIPYGGSVEGKVVFINGDSNAWGITPAPWRIDDDGYPLWHDGATSVFGDAHPLGARPVVAGPVAKAGPRIVTGETVPRGPAGQFAPRTPNQRPPRTVGLRRPVVAPPGGAAAIPAATAVSRAATVLRVGGKVVRGTGIVASVVTPPLTAVSAYGTARGNGSSRLESTVESAAVTVGDLGTFGAYSSIQESYYNSIRMGQRHRRSINGATTKDGFQQNAAYVDEDGNLWTIRAKPVYGTWGGWWNGVQANAGRRAWIDAERR